MFDIWLNSLDPALKFEIKYDISKVGVEFLDIYFYFKNGRIESKVFSKPCDPHAYLLPSSCHPYHICENIPVGVFKRLKRTCSTSDAYEEAVVEYTRYLHNRDYSQYVIDKAINTVKDIDRKSLIGIGDQSRNNNRKLFYPLTIKFNPKLPNMSRILNKYKYILSLNDITNRVFPAESILVTYKNERNIKSLLTTNRFGSPITVANPINDQTGCRSCKTCTLCKNFLREGDTIHSYHTSHTHRIRSTVTCLTKGVIYIVYDKTCEKNYVGFSRNDMRERWSNHKSHIKKQFRSCKIATHFKEHMHDKYNLMTDTQAKFTESLKQHLEVMIIECVDPTLNDGNIDKTLLEREAYFQSYFKATSLYGGLCQRDTRRELQNTNNNIPLTFSSHKP